MTMMHDDDDDVDDVDDEYYWCYCADNDHAHDDGDDGYADNDYMDDVDVDLGVEVDDGGKDDDDDDRIQ